ncbi:hypothetical protein B0H67DRAFT_560092 [Lasiosphaeris hirsuta]|uniref:Uncharacterized protein n=1 Tax=Lasiosphaeris hirsuta TaxID=260670 RepID=A0AA40B8Z8_9PEZI|nr:hypothetical protein B0H67DRAFT_560092 [Lasiosphaeris hirsuta]
MLRRHSIKSKSDLQRRKSTSSVHSVHLEHIDPALAQRDAQIAASEAFTRAQSRAKLDMPLFPPTPDSSPRRRQIERSGSSRDDKNGDENGQASSKGLYRRQSVRFMGPFSVQGKSYQDGSACTKSDSMDIDRAPAQTEGKRAVYSPQSYTHDRLTTHPPKRPYRAPPPPPPIPLPGIAAGYIHALAAGDEYYTPEDDIASAPSSYRRLRRSRSMFASEENQVRKSQEHSSSLLGGRLQSSKPSPTSYARRMLHSDPRDDKNSRMAPPLRTPRSMSFLKTRHILTGSRTSRDGNPEGSPVLEVPSPPENKPLTAAQSTPQLYSKASAVFFSRNRRTEPIIRKSLRDHSLTDGSVGVHSTAPGMPLGKEDGFKTKARKASKSLKTKFKSLFSLSKSEEDPPSIPSQHIESQRTYLSDGFGSLVFSEAGQDLQSILDSGSIHKVPSRLPSLQTLPANIIHSSRGSLESLRSDRLRMVSDDRSLTSWTNSGPSTLTSQQQQEWREWERQRLSIIGENGAHAASPSIRRQALDARLFQRQEDVVDTPTRPHGYSTDSQRIYSALMKRIQAISNKHAEIVEQQSRSSLSPSYGTPLVRPIGNADDTPRANQSVAAFESTSRSLNPIDTPTRGPAKLKLSSDPDERDQILNRATSPTPSLREPNLQPAMREVRGLCAAFLAGRSTSASLATSEPRASSPDPFTSRLSDRASPTKELKVLSDRGSAFFGSPTSHLFRTTSPYRRALRQSIQEGQTSRTRDDSGSEQLISEDGTQIRVINGSDMIRSISSESASDNYYEESIYSTDGYEHATDQAANAGNGRHGPGSPATYRPAGYRVDSSVSSIDWKTWLSANVAKMESSPTPSRRSEVEYALPTMPKCFSGGHVRESTQIYEDYEEDVGMFEPPTHKPSLPTSPLATVEPNVVKISPPQRSGKRATPPATRHSLHENESPTQAPPIPIKSALRATPSPMKRARSNVGHAVVPSITSSPGLTAAVQRQFGPVSKHSGPAADFDSTTSADTDDDDERLRGSGLDNQAVLGELGMGEFRYGGYQQRVDSSDKSGAFL